MLWWLDCQCSLYTAFILALLYFIPDLFPSLPYQCPPSTSLPLFSHLAAFFFCHLTCPALLLPRHQTGSSQNYFMLLWTLRGLCSWALCPALTCQRAAWGRGLTPLRRALLRCRPAPVLLALCSLRFGLLSSVSKVTQTASHSSPQLPVGFPGTAHLSGFVLPCFSCAFRVEGCLLQPSLREHPLCLVNGKAGLGLRLSPDKPLVTHGTAAGTTLGRPGRAGSSWGHPGLLFITA